MGTSPFIKVVYGVKETPEMLAARQVTVPDMRPVCPKRKRHYIIRYDPPNFCPKCGTKVEVRDVATAKTIWPHIAYAPAGLDPANNARDADEAMNSPWIHTTGPAYDFHGVVLGIDLVGPKHPREDADAHNIPQPTPEQKAELAAYLKDKGLYHMPVGTFLIIGGA